MTKDNLIRTMRLASLRKGTSSILAIAMSVYFALAPATMVLAKVDPGSPSRSTAGLTPAIPVFPSIPQTAESVGKVDSLLEDAGKLIVDNDLSNALAKFQEAYGMCLEMRYGTGQGRALVGMSTIYLAQGKKVKAKQLAENALEVLSGGSDPRVLAQARIQLAQCYVAFDNAVWAAEQLDKAFKEVSDLGSSDPNVAASITLLGAEILVKAGKHGDALRAYKRASSCYQQANNPQPEMITRMYLMNMLMQLGFTTAALEEAKETINRANENKMPEVAAAALAMKASCQYRLGEIFEARKTCEEALYAIGEGKNPDAVVVARIKAGYGLALAACGEDKGAEVLIKKALPVLKGKELGIVQALYTNVLGTMEVERHNYSSARAYFKEALGLADISTMKRPLQNASILLNLAAAEARSGNFNDAKTSLLSALGIIQKERDQTYYGRVLAGLAEVCLDLKQTEESEKYLRKAIEVSTTIKDDAALWRDYTIQANLQLSRGDERGAKESLGSALSFFRSPQSVLNLTPERLWFPSTRNDLGYELVSLLVWEGSFESAILAGEQLKEERFVQGWRHSGAPVKKEELDIYRDFVARNAQLHAVEEGTTPDKLVGEWTNWLTRFNQLAAENESLARLISPVPMSVSKIKEAAAKRKGIIIDYLVGRDSTLVFLISADGRISGEEVKVGRPQLERQVTSLLASSASDYNQDGRLLSQLYDELIPESVRELLPARADQIVTVVPDSILFNLPFAALVDPSGKYFVEKHTITLASSLGSIVGSPPPYARDLFIAIASDTGNSARLSGSEARLIEGAMRPGSVKHLSADGNQLSSLEDEARRNSVLHVPARIVFAGGNAFDSDIPIATTDKKAVRASSLFGLELPTDLTVLSNSSISADDVKGDTANVLSRGLGYAGVRNVLFSLWSDADAERQSQVLEFYKATQLGLSEARSLRKAQLLAISKNEAPKHWAAFQLIGPGN